MKIGKISSEELQVIYGKLNRELIPITYNAKSTNTANVTVQDNEISVDTIRTPGTLRVVDSNTGTLCEYDGSSDVTINTNESSMLARLKVLEQLLEREKLLNQQLEDIIERLVTVEDQVESSVVEPTAINPTGTYDKVYFNTSLSDDEVLQIIEKLEFVSFPYGESDGYANYVYAPYILTDFSNSIVILKSVNNNTASVNYMIVSFDNNLQVDEYYWFYNVDFNSYGWQEFVNPIPFATVGGVDNFDGLPVGQQNDLLKNLVSATPFKDTPSTAIVDVAELPNPVTKSAINPLGTYNKIGVNTNIDSAILNEKLNYIIDNIEIPIYMLYSDANKNGYAFQGTQNSDGLIVLHFVQTFSDGTTSDPIFSFASNESGFYLENVKESYDITLENGVESFVIEEGTEDETTIPVGQFNEYIQDLIYALEVNENAVNTKALYRLPDGTLWHYNGQWNAVGGDEKGGTPIKPTGTYDKIYFNTSLSTEEVDAMLSQLEYMKYDDIDTYGILVNSAFTQGILVMKGAFGETSFYIIAYQNQELNEMITVYSSASTGWQDESYSEFEFGSITGINEMDGTPIGHQNELLKDLISATPFKNNSSVAIVDVAKLPNPTTGDIITSTGIYDTFYFNTDLSVEEVDSILSKLPYKNGAYSVYRYDNYRSDGARILFDVVIIVNKDYVSHFGVTGEGYMIMCSRDLDTLSTIYNSFESGFGGATNNTIGWQGINSYSFNPTYVENPVYIAGEQNNLLRDLIYAKKVLDVSQINTKVLYRTPDGVLWHCNGQWTAIGDEVLKLNLSDIESTPMSDDVVDKVLNNKISKIELTLMSDETGGFVIYLEPSFVMNVGDKAHIIYSNVNPYILDEMKPWFFGITLDPESKIFVRTVDTWLLSRADMMGLYPPANMSSKSIKTVSTSDTFMGYTHNIVDFVNINADFSGNFSFADDIDKHKERTLYLKNLKSSLTYTISNDLGDATSGTTLYNNSKYNTSDIVKILNARVIKLTGITGNIILQYNYDTNIWTISDGFVGTLTESE